MPDYSNSIGVGLRKYRKLHRLSQSELADKLGMSQSSLSKIESGDSIPRAAHFDSVFRIAAEGNSCDINAAKENEATYFRTPFLAWISEVLKSDLEYAPLLRLVRDATDVELRNIEKHKSQMKE